MSEAPAVKCPNCPMCGAEPPYIFPTMHQAMCPNEACNVFMWVPWDTAAANLGDMHELEIRESS